MTRKKKTRVYNVLSSATHSDARHSSPLVNVNGRATFRGHAVVPVPWPHVNIVHNDGAGAHATGKTGRVGRLARVTIAGQLTPDEQQWWNVRAWVDATAWADEKAEHVWINEGVPTMHTPECAADTDRDIAAAMAANAYILRTPQLEARAAFAAGGIPARRETYANRGHEPQVHGLVEVDSEPRAYVAYCHVCGERFGVLHDTLARAAETAHRDGRDTLNLAAIEHRPIA